MYRVKPMPLTGGFLRLSRLRGSIATLKGGESENRERSGGLDFPSFDIPSVPSGFMLRTQRKPTPIDLRLRMDLRDVRLYVDVIVDMLLQSLDGRASSGGLPQNDGFARQLASNPEARRILNKLLERADRLDPDKKLSPEEIIRMLLSGTSAADGGEVAPLSLPLSLRNIAVTREKSASQSRLGRRERLIRETRRLVLAQIRAAGQNAEIFTRHKDGGSALHVVVAREDGAYRNTDIERGMDEGFVGRTAGQEHAQESVTQEKAQAQRQRDQADAPQSFAAAKVEYLQGYRRVREKTQAGLAEKLVDAKTLSRLSAEAAANLNRMLEEGKLIPSKAAKPDAQRANTAETAMTYASLYSGERKPNRGYNIIVKNLYFTDKMPGAKGIKIMALSDTNPHYGTHLRYAVFGRGIGGFSGSGAVTERKIAAGKPVIQGRGGVREQSGTENSAMFFAESPAAMAAAGIAAQQSAMARQANPEHGAPDMTKLKKELAAQAGKELDDIIRKKLDTDKLADKIYRNLENRLRSERIRRGIT